MKPIKNQTYNNIYYKSSTIPKGTYAELGTIEKDSTGLYGKHISEEFRGKKILDKLLQDPKINNFKNALDIGAGECKQSDYLRKHNKKVYTCDFGEKGTHCDHLKYNYDYVGNFLDINFDKQFDVTLASHILEHQINPNIFLKKLSSVTKESGHIVIIIPPRKPFVTGGHFSIWNAGLVLYNLVMAGVNCSTCYIKQYDYNIGLIIQNNTFNINNIPLKYDQYDIENYLLPYFPDIINSEPFNGDILTYNW